MEDYRQRRPYVNKPMVSSGLLHFLPYSSYMHYSLCFLSCNAFSTASSIRSHISISSFRPSCNTWSAGSMGVEGTSTRASAYNQSWGAARVCAASRHSLVVVWRRRFIFGS
jgi:hypothetical protein